LSRDRDPAGKPRNARPRDALGRPLPRSDVGLATIPDELALAGPDAARLADELLRAGRPFHAHEVLEASWKSAPPDERDLWQGLAQVAVGLTHAHRGNARGAVTLLRRGADRVRAYQVGAEPTAHGEAEPAAHGEAEPAAHGEAEPAALDAAESSASGGRPYGIDIAAVLAACDDLAARIEQRGLADIPAADLRPGLLAQTEADGASAPSPLRRCGRLRPAGFGSRAPAADSWVPLALFVYLLAPAKS
jgi:hypothetical protein